MMQPLFPNSFTYLLLLSARFARSINLNCEDVADHGQHWNFKALDNDYSIYTIVNRSPRITNTTFSINLCRSLSKLKDLPKGENCPTGSRVCAREIPTNTAGDKQMPGKTIPIAGEFGQGAGPHLDPKATRLKTSESNADREKEGVRLELNGGRSGNTKQKAIVEFICRPDSEDSEDVTKRRSDHLRSASDDKFKDEETDEGSDDANDDGKEDKSGEMTDDGHGGQLSFLSWVEEESQTKVLRLQWDTKFACEDTKSSGDKQSSSHWGFFTWFIIIVFMGVAAYLIFGSWLNYNRYSARGWDLLPHSETLRDIPYLFRDWMRRVINTVQGGGSRGGYSAV